MPQVLDELAREGLRLEQHYTQPECSTTRASLLSSRYIVRTGLQADVILNGGGMALPLNETLMSQYLKQLGYKNYLVGKWHQGANSWRETPVFRGFDYFYGYYGGQIHYFAHYHTKFGGHDFRRDYRDDQGNFHQDILKDELGNYLTKCLTDEAIRIVKEEEDSDDPMFLYFSLPNTHSPNQSPKGYVNKYFPQDSKITDYDRKQFSGNLGGLEESVKNLTDVLKKSKKWENTLLVFISDNGGAPNGLMSYAGQSNYPLRSGKTTLYEGALRVPAFVSGPLVKHLAGKENHGMFHVSDWFPTLQGLIKQRTGKTVKLASPIDGVDQADMILNNGPSVRKEMLHQLNLGDQAYRLGDYKIIVGNPGEYDGYNVHADRPLMRIKYDEPEDFLGKLKCTIGLCGGYGDYITDSDGAKVRLYNLKDDPSETYNIAAKNPEVVRKMRDRIEELRGIVMPAQANDKIPAAHHKKSGGIWKPWRDDMKDEKIGYRVLVKTEL